MNTAISPTELAAVPGSPSRADKMSAMVSWLIEYHEGWHGPRARWSKKQRDDFDAKAGFLMLFIDGFKFTKENNQSVATPTRPTQQHSAPSEV